MTLLEYARSKGLIAYQDGRAIIIRTKASGLPRGASLQAHIQAAKAGMGAEFAYAYDVNEVDNLAAYMGNGGVQ